MNNRLIIPTLIYEELRAHLFSTDVSEREAFMIGGWSGCDIFVRKLILVQSEDLEEEGNYGLSLKDEKKVSVVRECKREKGCLIEAHTHPFSTDNVEFSSYDDENLAEFVKYIRIRLPNTPYCATVWGKNSISGLVWAPSYHGPKPVVEIGVRGSIMMRMPTANSIKSGTKRGSSSGSTLYATVYDRQIRAFGESGQKAISNFRVGIVGVGGIGSHVLQQLAYLGVKEIVVVDDDKIDQTNLNRLVGAKRNDSNKYKTKVLSGNAKRINPTLKINANPLKLRSEEALIALKSVDMLFGCVDNDGARLLIAELAASYLIPYFDCATSIESDNEGLTQAGGRVMCYLPLETPCLWCSRQIDQREASFDLASETEKTERVKRGYYNVQGPAPAVISLNGVIASLASNEYLALIAGFGKTVNVRYDAVKSMVRQQKWEIDRSCAICQASFGLGDRANIERYVLPA